VPEGVLPPEEVVKKTSQVVEREKGNDSQNTCPESNVFSPEKGR